MRKELKWLKKYKIWLFLAIAILIIIGFLKEPVFFDSFGIMVFAFLLISSSYMIIKRKYPIYIIYLIWVISISGLVIDGINVLRG